MTGPGVGRRKPGGSSRGFQNKGGYHSVATREGRVARVDCTRIAQLQLQSGQLEVPTAVGYGCQGLKGKTLFATFYSQTEPPSAVVIGGDSRSMR